MLGGLSDGRIYQHPFEFTEAPSLKEFRQHYKNAKQLVLDLMAKQDQTTTKATPKTDKSKEQPKEENER